MDRDKIKERDAASKRCCMCLGWTIFAGCMAACCAVGLIVCGAVIAAPVIETKSLEFLETTCTTNNSYLTGQNIVCGCGEECSSNYPCLRMTVTYVVNNVTYDGVLFDTESRLNVAGDNAENRQCVTVRCSDDERDNRANVLNFNDTYAPGQSYKCLYHPDRPTKVLLTRLFTYDAMFHSMLWTSIGTFIFTVLMIYCWYQCHQACSIQRKACSIHVPISVPPQAPGASAAAAAPPGAQSGYFITQPPSYSAPGKNLPMHPPPQNLYSSEKSGYTYT
ncbi:calcium-activated potassium channel subunit beta-2-like [Branchiostoma floridae]|uniref:Calcium-activated potassium channel subunit beta-2-like n=1 Tax=Branchiostoma floridae TaxID=7739 RepID=A0A9J7MAL3_BRAFL|nr:calcium-activated potassium channel subunit beta-2-like [Branchiostoma floridae]